MQLQIIVERSTALPVGQRFTFVRTKADAEQVWLTKVAGIGAYGAAGATLEWYSLDVPIRNAGDLADYMNLVHASLENGPQGMVAAEFPLVNYLQASSDPGLKAPPKAKPKAKRKVKRKAKAKVTPTSAAGIRLVPKQEL